MTPYAIVAYEPGAANIIDRATGTVIGQVLQWANGWGAYVQYGGELAFDAKPTRLALATVRTRYRADAAARVWAEWGQHCVNCGDNEVRARQRCVRCVKYLYRHGVDRPEDLAVSYFRKKLG